MRNAGLQLFNIFNLYFYCIKLSVKIINYWLLISKILDAQANYSILLGLRSSIGVSNHLYTLLSMIEYFGILVSPTPSFAAS